MNREIILILSRNFWYSTIWYKTTVTPTIHFNNSRVYSTVKTGFFCLSGFFCPISRVWCFFRQFYIHILSGFFAYRFFAPLTMHKFNVFPSGFFCLSGFSPPFFVHQGGLKNPVSTVLIWSTPFMFRPIKTVVCILNVARILQITK